MATAYPIVYVRGYAGTQPDVEETVDDPFYGFNLGSTHIRLDEEGRADFFVFESPFVRLLTDHQYVDVFDGARHWIDPESKTPERTIWIYRYYDPTSKTYDRPGGRRLSIEEAAEGLRAFIGQILQSSGARKVNLVAHSMGGLVSRSLLQKIYPEHGEQARDHVDKFVTFGTPHGGILFAVGGGALERLRDLFGVNDSDVFGRQRMYEFLTPGARRGAAVPAAFDPRAIPGTAFDIDRVLCIVGTNARDYEVAQGVARTIVGPQSDGLVQIQTAAAHESHRAFIHRSHSGRYGMVNSEEGYQNLERFLFGDVRVYTVLSDFDLAFPGPPEPDVTYQIELRVAIRGLPVAMHERSKAHYCAVSLNRGQFAEQKAKGGLPLCTTFLIRRFAGGHTMRYTMRLGVYAERFRKGVLILAGHVEQLPIWSDYVIVDVTTDPRTQALTARYSWASESLEPNRDLELTKVADGATAFLPLPDRARSGLGPTARLRLHASEWD